MNRLMILVTIMFSVSACGIADNMSNISDKMAGMNGRIDAMATDIGNMQGSVKKMADSLSSTSNGIHAQALTIALNEMFKPENTKYITLTSANPIPMIPSAKGFAELATQEELAGITYIIMSEINTCQVDKMDLTKEQKDKYDLDKFIKLTALQLIASFIPEKTIDEMILKQITEGGSYVDSVYTLVTLRSVFIKDVMLDQLVSAAKKLTSPKQYETALEYLETLTNISKYPFASNLKIKIYGMYDTDNAGLNQTIESVITADSLKKYYKMLSDKIESDLDAQYKTDTKRIDAIKERIKKGL
jgi:hypothetical protein